MRWFRPVGTARSGGRRRYNGDVTTSMSFVGACAPPDVFDTTPSGRQSARPTDVVSGVSLCARRPHVDGVSVCTSGHLLWVPGPQLWTALWAAPEPPGLSTAGAREHTDRGAGSSTPGAQAVHLSTGERATTPVPLRPEVTGATAAGRAFHRGDVEWQGRPRRTVADVTLRSTVVRGGQPPGAGQSAEAISASHCLSWAGSSAVPPSSPQASARSTSSRLRIGQLCTSRPVALTSRTASALKPSHRG